MRNLRLNHALALFVGRERVLLLRIHRLHLSVRARISETVCPLLLPFSFYTGLLPVTHACGMSGNALCVLLTSTALPGLLHWVRDCRRVVDHHAPLIVNNLVHHLIRPSIRLRCNYLVVNVMSVP